MSVDENVLRMEGTGPLVVHGDRRIGSILSEQGKLVDDDIERVMALQATEGCRFGDAALRLGLITVDDVHDAVLRQYNLPRPGHARAGTELVIANEPYHPRAEEFRTLRTQLLMRWSKAGVKRRILAIISPGAGEGRSYVAANLALALSQLGERTLLIDADLRTPRQHRIFDVPDRVGLTAVLSDRAGPGAAVAVPEYGPLSILTAGARPPNPQELLSRAGLGALLDALQSQFDVILLDTPPARFYADAQAVAGHAGNALVLARKNHTRLGDAKELIGELGDISTRVVGTVLTDF